MSPDNENVGVRERRIHLKMETLYYAEGGWGGLSGTSFVFNANHTQSHRKILTP